MMVYYNNNHKTNAPKTMTHITRDQFEAYLQGGAKLADIKIIREMFDEHIREVEGMIEQWYELLPPSATEWGSETRRANFKTIVTFLKQQGFDLSYVCVSPDGGYEDAARWIVSKGDRSGQLHWSADINMFWVEGIAHPRDTDFGYLLAFPLSLRAAFTWIEPD